MWQGPVVFIDIDTQRDFLEPGGALYITGSAAIRPNLARLTAFARANNIPVLATACAHTLDEADPEPFPPHCLVGSPGQRRIAETEWPGSLIIGPDDRFSQAEIAPHLTLEKRRYDVFSHPDADRIVELYARHGPAFIVYGVATDYCVKAAAIGLLARRQRVVVVTDAIRAVDPAGEPHVLTEFVQRGAVLTVTELVC
jgi:nicotinamidase/pyrazinamidase